MALTPVRHSGSGFRVFTAAVVLVAGGWLLAACGGSGTGTVTGHVLVNVGVTMAAPTYPTTVELLSGGQVVAKDHVAAKGTFRFTVPAGTYRLNVVGIANCSGQAKVRAHGRTSANVACDPHPGIG